jgi:hypothetical protein
VSSTSEATVQERPGSAAAASAKGREPSEHREDGSRTPVPRRNLSKDSGSDTAQSLWDRAYVALRTEDPGLVEKYEKVLSRELTASAY